VTRPPQDRRASQTDADPDRADANPIRVVAVLGHRLRSPELHDTLAGRMDVGIERFRETDAEYLVVSGAATNPAVDRPEADAMREYAIGRGVDPERVVVDPEADDTIENGFYVRRAVGALARSVDAVSVVTSCYHAERAAYIFEQCFGDDVAIDAERCYDEGAVNQQRRAAERESFRRAREFFDPIEPGDVDAIRRRLAEEKGYDVPECSRSVTTGDE